MVAPKREKMACQRRLAPKKREREKKGVTMSQKRERDKDDSREKTIAWRSKPYPSIHLSIHLHLLIEIAWLVSPWILALTLQYIEYKFACSYPTLSSTKAVVVGKIKGRYCPGKKIQVECLGRVILGTLHSFRKSFKKVSPDGLRIYEQVSTTLCTVLTLSSPRQGDN